MGFFDRFFKRRKKQTEQIPEEDWGEIVLDHNGVDFSDEEQRSRYIMNCMEQIADASREINQIGRAHV